MQSAIESVLETPELIQNILLYADYDTILNYCRTHKAASQICQNRIFWEERLISALMCLESYLGKLI